MPVPLQKMRGNPLPPAPVAAVRKVVQFGKPVTGQGHRIVLYGTGGWGKTTLASKLPDVAFIDLDESLGRLKLDVPCVNVADWQELRSALQSDGWDKVKTIVIDTATKAEELAVAHTLKTVKTEKGLTATSIEAYGYGKGYTHVFETFMGLLMDLDRHARQGRNVILICHDCVTMVPNPQGEDWQRFEPRLQSPASGKYSIRLRVKEWSDSVVFGNYDVAVSEKKAKGSGTRTLWCSELPFCMAKSRTARGPLVVDDEGSVWNELIY